MSVFDHPSLHSRAPWIHPVAYYDVDFVKSSAAAPGVLPGGIPLEASDNFEWKARVIMTDKALRSSRATRTMAEHRSAFGLEVLYEMELP